MSKFGCVRNRETRTSFSVQFRWSGGNSAVSERWKKEYLPEFCVGTVEIFDPETETWTFGPELPNPLCGAGKMIIIISCLEKLEFSNACKNWGKMLGKDIEWTEVFAVLKKI